MTVGRCSATLAGVNNLVSDQKTFDLRLPLLQQQLGIAWGFAEDVVLPEVDQDRCLWEPSEHVVSVRRVDGVWAADWPDEDRRPLPDVTIGWLLWHVEWWWGNAVRAARGEQTSAPADHYWSGSTAGIRDAKSDWDEVLATGDLDRQIVGVMSVPKTLAFVAAWVNFELTKNLSEMNQLLTRYGNTRNDPSA